MKCVILILILIGSFTAANEGMEAYAEYKHERIIEECKNQAKAEVPSWLHGATNWGCEKWAD